MFEKWAIWVGLTAGVAAPFVAAVAAPPAAAAPDELSPEVRRDQIAAATARAVELLRSQIAREPIGRNLTVQDLLERTGGHDYLVKTLQRAQQIGGPRWPDPQTCQVQLDISGPRVRQALVSIAATNARRSPLPPEIISGRLQSWDNLTFSATGTSTGAAALVNLRPIEEGAAWTRVSDEARQQATTRAKQAAAAEVLERIKPVPLTAVAGGPGEARTMGDVLAHPPARAAVEAWLASRPVTQVEFRDDLQVRVTLATPSDELFDAIRAAAEKQPNLVAGVTPADWDRARAALAARVPPTAQGTSRAGVLSVTRAAMNVQRPAPHWIDDQIDADGAGPVSETRLKAARAAERDAQAKLRLKIDALEIAPQQTLGPAARQDPRLNEAINRAVQRARLTRVDYQSDRSARVRVALDLRDLWAEIASLP